MADTLSAQAASRLATEIQVYWVGKGLRGVRVWAEPLQVEADGEKAIIFQVRSNIDRLIREREICLSL